MGWGTGSEGGNGDAPGRERRQLNAWAQWKRREEERGVGEGFPSFTLKGEEEQRRKEEKRKSGEESRGPLGEGHRGSAQLLGLTLEAAE